MQHSCMNLGKRLDWFKAKFSIFTILMQLYEFWVECNKEYVIVY